MSVNELCIGPWEGSPRMTMNYDIGILGAGYDPANVLTCMCITCRERWSYDSPSSECRYCERERLIDYLMEENERLRTPAAKAGLNESVPAGQGGTEDG